MDALEDAVDVLVIGAGDEGAAAAHGANAAVGHVEAAGVRRAGERAGEEGGEGEALHGTLRRCTMA